MTPKLSYTIWFTQRTGSTLLCAALESTGIAGVPREWLNIENPADLPAKYDATPADLQSCLWDLGSTPNGVFGMKFGFYEPYFTRLLDLFCQFPDVPQDSSRTALWDHAFPNCRHIFMTRRNKVRLAVSWWKAIQSNEWHRETGQAPTAADLSDAYNFDAINHLFNETSMREAGIQEFFSEAGIVPLTIVYEDFIQDFVSTVQNVLGYLGLESAAISPPHYEQLADSTTEAWVQRFREERQRGWTNRGW